MQEPQKHLTLLHTFANSTQHVVKSTHVSAARLDVRVRGRVDRSHLTLLQTSADSIQPRPGKKSVRRSAAASRTFQCCRWQTSMGHNTAKHVRCHETFSTRRIDPVWRERF